MSGGDTKLYTNLNNKQHGKGVIKHECIGYVKASRDLGRSLFTDLRRV